MHGERRNKKWTHFKCFICQELQQQDCSAGKIDMKEAFTSFIPRVSLDLWSKERKVLQGTTHLASWLAFSSDNLACSQLSKSHGCWPKMIYTLCFLNINHRAQPSCKTDVRLYDCTVVVPFRRPGYLWT